MAEEDNEGEHKIVPVEGVDGKHLYSLPGDIRKVVVELDKLDRKKLRAVSAADKDGKIPSLTITAELKELNLTKGDWVLVGVEDKRIVIEIAGDAVSKSAPEIAKQ
jgi:hypothetical protein